jgi:hypothetical protein
MRHLEFERFGRLLVLERSEKIKGRYYWLCRCDCGVVCDVNHDSLVSGRTKSCGCLRVESGRRKRIPQYRELYNNLTRNAKRAQCGLLLSFEEFLSFTTIENCHYCGVKISWKPRSKPRAAKYNLDRKDNSMGYSKHNCVVCCSFCNYTKGDRFTYSQFLKIGELIRGFKNESK